MKRNALISTINNNSKLGWIDFSPMIVKKYLPLLTAKFSRGPDFVPNYVLKIISFEFTETLSILSNASLTMGGPEIWKKQ